MSTDAKSAPSSSTPSPTGAHRGQGIRIFMWPKVIFLYPTALVALICAAGMSIIHDRTHDPTKPLKTAVDAKYLTPGSDAVSQQPATSLDKVDRFRTPQNLLAMLFLAHVRVQSAGDGTRLPAVLARGGDPRASSSAVLLALARRVFSSFDLTEAYPLDLQSASTPWPTRASISWSS